jgi:hypothetical protein
MRVRVSPQVLVTSAAILFGISLAVAWNAASQPNSTARGVLLVPGGGGVSTKASYASGAARDLLLDRPP